MHAIRLTSTLGDDRQLTLALPPDFPAGSVEVIVLSTRPPSMTRFQDLPPAERAARIQDIQRRWHDRSCASEAFALAKADEIAMENRRWDTSHD